MENKLCELESCELIDNCGYKYKITCYEDITEVKYIEKDNNSKWIEKHKYELTSSEDIQICEKIIEMRKRFNERNGL